MHNNYFYGIILYLSTQQVENGQFSLNFLVVIYDETTIWSVVVMIKSLLTTSLNQLHNFVS